MQRTIALKIKASTFAKAALEKLTEAYAKACNEISLSAYEHLCWNRVALHNKVYSRTRANSSLGSQMVCNAIFSVCKAYKAKKATKKPLEKPLQFRKNGSVHFDKRTYTMKENILSLYTLEGRIKVEMQIGEFQKGYLKQGILKEAELICKRGQWYFHLVLDMPESSQIEGEVSFAIDLGENNVAAMSSGKLIRGGKIRHDRDKHLARRRKLQSNGSRSAKRLLKRISGKESRRMRNENHKISKVVIEEAIKYGAAQLVLEDLTNIRERIRAKKRERTRLHRWSFNQLQQQIEYKAVSAGLRVLYVNPAYSTKLCLDCNALGRRHKNTFTCQCGNRQHSDLYSCEKLCRFARSADLVTATVNRPMVAREKSFSYKPRPLGRGS